MAIDQRLLLAAEREPFRPQTVLRLYKWSVPTLSLGYAQKPEEAADLDFCRRQGVPLVRRPTGGRAVLHDMELTYAVISNDSQTFPTKSNLETYRQIAGALRMGLERIGLPIALSNGSERLKIIPPTHMEHNYLRTRVPCFTSPARYELLCRGKKIMGSAQRRLRHAFLQHGSLLLDCNLDLLAAVTRSDKEFLQSSITTVRQQRTEAISEEDVAGGLCSGFTAYFSATLAEASLSEAELDSAQELAGSFRL